MLNTEESGAVYLANKRGCAVSPSKSCIRICLNKSELSTLDSTGLKKWFIDNNAIFIHLLSIPVTSCIDKSIAPTIQVASKINILEVDSPVAPSSFKATLPINKNAEQDAEIQNLKDRLNTVMNVLYANPLLVNTYIDQEVQESQKAINERMM